MLCMCVCVSKSHVKLYWITVYWKSILSYFNFFIVLKWCFQRTLHQLEQTRAPVDCQKAFSPFVSLAAQWAVPPIYRCRPSSPAHRCQLKCSMSPDVHALPRLQVPHEKMFAVRVAPEGGLPEHSSKETVWQLPTFSSSAHLAAASAHRKAAHQRRRSHWRCWWQIRQIGQIGKSRKRKKQTSQEAGRPPPSKGCSWKGRRRLEIDQRLG